MTKLFLAASLGALIAFPVIAQGQATVGPGAISPGPAGTPTSGVAAPATATDGQSAKTMSGKSVSGVGPTSPVATASATTTIEGTAPVRIPVVKPGMQVVGRLGIPLGVVERVTRTRRHGQQVYLRLDKRTAIIPGGSLITSADSPVLVSSKSFAEVYGRRR